VDYSTVFSSAPIFSSAGATHLIFFGYNFDLLSFICFFLFIGAVGKSAQIGLHT
jgi:NADH-quinone oxidoreductase subunit L